MIAKFVLLIAGLTMNLLVCRMLPESWSVLFLLFSSFIICFVAPKLYVLPGLWLMWAIIAQINGLLLNPSGFGYKIFVGIVFPIFLVNFVPKSLSIDRLIRGLLVYILFILIVAVITKLENPFNRSEKYGLFGSIVFGWHMGMGLLICYYREAYRSLFSITVFTLGLLWSGSKGPLIMIVVLLLLGQFSIKKFLRFFPMFGIIWLLSDTLFKYSRAFRGLARMGDLFRGSLSAADSGSVGTRADFILYSWDIFSDFPAFGIGLNNWAHPLTRHTYPHNIFLEVFSELGLPMGLLFVVLVFYTIVKLQSLPRILALYLLMVLLVSGDLSYFRYFIFLSLTFYAFKGKKDFSANYRTI